MTEGQRLRQQAGASQRHACRCLSLLVERPLAALCSVVLDINQKVAKLQLNCMKVAQMMNLLYFACFTSFVVGIVLF